MAKNAQNFEQRPWGTFEVISEFSVITEDNKKADVVVKKLEVLPGKRLSYQSHKLREETWFIVQGQGLAILDDKELPLSRGQVIHVPIGTRHRFGNTGSDLNLVAIEIGQGEFDELDNIRYDDDFGRA